MVKDESPEGLPRKRTHAERSASTREALIEAGGWPHTVGEDIVVVRVALGDAVLIGDLLDQKQWTLSTMESLTGGLIASALTDEHASSAHFFGGIVSYSTPLKEKIGVPHEVVERYGVISEETAKAMARAVHTFLDTELGLGITGVAGPDKQEDQPVGTVYIAVDGPDGMMTAMGSECCAGSDREENKQAATISALNLLRRYLEREGDANRQPS